MEDDLQSEVVGIGEDIFIELHHVLLVASKEIDLDAKDAGTLHPCHLLATGAYAVHLMTWSLGGIVPTSVGVVPKEETHALALGVT